jgi:hypothetical protein
MGSVLLIRPVFQVLTRDQTWLSFSPFWDNAGLSALRNPSHPPVSECERVVVHRVAARWSRYDNVQIDRKIESPGARHRRCHQVPPARFQSGHCATDDNHLQNEPSRLRDSPCRCWSVPERSGGRTGRFHPTGSVYRSLQGFSRWLRARTALCPGSSGSIWSKHVFESLALLHLLPYIRLKSSMMIWSSGIPIFMNCLINPMTMGDGPHRKIFLSRTPPCTWLSI